MQILTFFILFIAFISSLLLVYFQYFFKEKKNKSIFVLAFLRFITVFSILLLLINPKFEKKSYKILKPKLFIAVDNSASIAFAKQDTIVHDLVDKIRKHKDLNSKFDVAYFSFGKSLKNSSVFDFQESQTNIFEALTALNAISKEQNSPVILISDGNQTYGNDYRYYNSKNAIYPIIVGDTTHFSDIEISRINVNTYAHLDNKFPVEVFVNYNGVDDIKLKFVIEENGQVVYSKLLNFSANKKSEHLQFNLPANKIGKHFYQAKIEAFENERNKVNNLKNFTVEVIDEKTKIALVYDILHPDIGMLKRVIETNQRRHVTLIDLNNMDNNDIDSNVFILYQPNSKFDKIFKWIQKQEKNYFIITGKNTDWNLLNNIQDDFKRETSFQTESYGANYNNNFNAFYMEDIGFEDFPPLKDAFGTLEISVPYQTLLFQNINGLQTQYPLLVTISNNTERRVLLFGENIWKWRAWAYSLTQSFEKFDQFFNSLIQFLTITNKNTSLDLEYNSFYYANDIITIKAKSYDDNLNFDNNANLELFLNGKNRGIPLYKNEHNYEVQLSDLKSGTYDFKVVNSQNNNQSQGSFKVVKYAVEHEILSANIKGLKSVAKNSKATSYFPKEVDELFNLLIENQNFASIQKENKKIISLIDWRWYLLVIILSLSIEWFIRKYRGLI